MVIHPEIEGVRACVCARDKRHAKTLLFLHTHLFFFLTVFVPCAQLLARARESTWTQRLRESSLSCLEHWSARVNSCLAIGPLPGCRALIGREPPKPLPLSVHARKWAPLAEKLLLIYDYENLLHGRFLTAFWEWDIE